MANIGDQLPEVESNMQRIDDFNVNFKYSNYTVYPSGQVGFNGTCHSLSNEGRCEFYFYGSLLRILGTDYTTKFDIDLKIDDEDYIINIKGELGIYDTQIATGRLLFQKLDLDKKIHHVVISNNTSYEFEIDAIDIDSDGYMVYCDDNGKLYYDVTPIMTSNTTPSPYVVSASSVRNNVSYYEPWYSFDGYLSYSPTDYATRWTSASNSNEWVSINLDHEISNILFLVNSIDMEVVIGLPKHFRLEGSNDNLNFTILYEKLNMQYSSSGNYLFYLESTVKYKYYRIYIVENNGAKEYCILPEIKFLLSVDCNIYIKNYPITYVDYNQPNKNFSKDLVKISPTTIVLCKYTYNKSYGYMYNTIMKLGFLNWPNTFTGTFIFGLIKESFDISTVTYNTLPKLDQDTYSLTVDLDTDIQLEITSLMKKLLSNDYYGVYIQTENISETLSSNRNSIVIDYIPTLLEYPKLIYNSKCLITWKEVIYSRMNSIDSLELWKDKNSDFSTATKILECDINTTSYLDTNLSYGTTYYKLVIKMKESSSSGEIKFENSLDYTYNKTIITSNKVSLEVISEAHTYSISFSDSDINDKVTLLNSDISEIANGVFKFKPI